MPFAPQPQVPLAPLTTWKIGGPAEWYAEPATRAELVDALHWARERQLPVRWLGRGSNLLVADSGVPGLVIGMRSFEQKRVERPDESVLVVSAGLSLAKLSKLVAQAGFAGYEFFVGIPGTVGGAVVMNAGYGPQDERQTSNRCVAVEVVDTNGVYDWCPYTDFHPRYRYTDLIGGELLVVGARFVLSERGDRKQIQTETAAQHAMRKEKQPLARPTSGSIFAASQGTPAAVYIDQCGLKGLRVGGAVVSEKHANWIENVGGATAADVEDLVGQIQAQVEQRFKIRLHPEIQRLPQVR